MPDSGGARPQAIAHVNRSASSAPAGEDLNPSRRLPRPCIVVGVGNPFMRDDGIGIQVVRMLRKLDLGPGVITLERQEADLSILVLAKEASKLVIVDAVKSGNLPGSVIRFSTDKKQATQLRIPVSHEPALRDIIALAGKSGVVLPPITVVGVEPADCSPGEGLSKKVADALPLLVKEVTDEVKECASRSRSSVTVEKKAARLS